MFLALPRFCQRFSVAMIYHLTAGPFACIIFAKLTFLQQSTKHSRAAALRQLYADTYHSSTKVEGVRRLRVSAPRTTAVRPIVASSTGQVGVSWRLAGSLPALIRRWDKRGFDWLRREHALA